MFIITLDTDWVPQFVLDHALTALGERGLAATVFCTGPYDLPDSSMFEAALHPNFMADSTQGEDPYEILGGLKSIWPGAVGSRSHRLFWHSGLRAVLAGHGVTYDCSCLLPLVPQTRPADSGGLAHFSIWWSDNQHMIHQCPPDRFDLPGMDEPGLKILAFHPIHVYLNTVRRKDYRAMRAAVPDLSSARPEDLKPWRHSGPGMETFFNAALDHVVKVQGQSSTLEDIVARHV